MKMYKAKFRSYFNLSFRLVRNLSLAVGFLLIPQSMMSCVYDTTDPSYYDDIFKKEYEYCKAFLNTHFLLRDSLPDDLNDFTSPESLYLSVNDPYTEYIEKKDVPDFYDYSNTKTENKNIGIEIDSVGTGVVITYVYPNSPAYEKKLQSGDTITAIDSISLAGISLSTVNGYLKENIDTSKILQIKRDTVRLETIEFREFSISVVYTDSLQCADSTVKPIAYIYVAAFLDNTGGITATADEVENALINTNWSTYTILDLRDNLGGMFNQSIEVVSKILPTNSEIIKLTKWVDTSITADGFIRDTILKDIDNSDYSSRTFYLLVNDSTAGAAEIMVSSIRENAVSIKIFGSKTFGLGVMQIITETPDSGIAKVTNAEIFSITGESYNGIGIEPDVEVIAGKDALEEALNDIDPGIISQNSNTINRIKELREKHRTRNRKPLCIKWVNE